MFVFESNLERSRAICIAKPCLEFGSEGEKAASDGLFSVSDHEMTAGTSFPGDILLLFELRSEEERNKDGEEECFGKGADGSMSLLLSPSPPEVFGVPRVVIIIVGSSVATSGGFCALWVLMEVVGFRIVVMAANLGVGVRYVSLSVGVAVVMLRVDASETAGWTTNRGVPFCGPNGSRSLGIVMHRSIAQGRNLLMKQT